MGHATPRAYRDAAAKGEPDPKKPSKIKYERKQKAIKEAEKKDSIKSVYKTLTTALLCKPYFYFL